MSPIFPRWTNAIPTVLAISTVVGSTAAVAGSWYWASPEYTDVGYQPEQPIAFSHRRHAGELGLDCRYCHNTVERAARAAVPPTATCMNCHRLVKPDDETLAVARNSAESGAPIPWIRVHQLPDYAYFDHSVHLSAGVGCVSCHGRIDQMDRVTLSTPLSMGWCLECHRAPEPNLRPAREVANMDFDASNYDPKTDPGRMRELQAPEHCSGCHR